MPGKIHIDHRIPCSAFDLSDPEQQKRCNHWSNLQPLWATDNQKKGNKLPPGVVHPNPQQVGACQSGGAAPSVAPCRAII